MAVYTVNWLIIREVAVREALSGTRATVRVPVEHPLGEVCNLGGLRGVFAYKAGEWLLSANGRGFLGEGRVEVGIVVEADQGFGVGGA